MVEGKADGVTVACWPGWARLRLARGTFTRTMTVDSSIIVNRGASAAKTSPGFTFTIVTIPRIGEIKLPLCNKGEEACATRALYLFTARSYFSLAWATFTLLPPPET